jgi:transcription antitermination factor NusG
MSDWCILRCAGRQTITLAETLAEDGFEVWTPVETRMMRVPRANVRREARLPIMPSYVFAKTHHLIDLLELAAMPVKPRRGAGRMKPAHASFSVLHAFDRIPVVSNQSLDGLRDREIMAVPRKNRKLYQAGEVVRVTKGSFEGMAGTVERSDGKEAEVWLSLFGRHFRAKIPAFLLRRDEISRGDIAVRRAA